MRRYMITPTHIKRYGIASIETSFFAIDDLFSGSVNDPSLDAELFASSRVSCFDIVYGVTADGRVAAQVIFFRNRHGYDTYMQDVNENNVLLFNEIEE